MWDRNENTILKVNLKPILNSKLISISASNSNLTPSSNSNLNSILSSILKSDSHSSSKSN